MGFLSGIFKRERVKNPSVYIGRDGGSYISQDMKTGIFLEGSSKKVRDRIKTILAERFLGLREEDAKGEMRRILEEVNGELYSQGEELSLIAFHQLEKYIALVHIGVSRAYILRDNEIIQVTEDDTQGWQLFKSGIMDEKKLRESPLGRMPTKLLGRSSRVQVNTGEYYFAEGEKLLLLSGEKALKDGDEKVWDIFSGCNYEELEGDYLLKIL